MRNSILFFLLFILLTSCFSSKRTPLQNTAISLEEGMSQAPVLYQVFRHTPDSITLFCQINTHLLLRVFSAVDKRSTVKYSLHGQILTTDEQQFVIDSFFLQKSIADTAHFLEEKILLPSEEHKNLLLKISLIDEHKASTFASEIYLQNSTSSHENFQIFKTKNRQYQTIFSEFDTLLLYPNQETKNLFVQLYQEDFPIASVPYITENLKPIHLLPKEEFNLSADTTFFTLPLHANGIFQISRNKDTSSGISVFSVKNEFPKITSLDEMMLPLQYLCTETEFQEMFLAKDKKSAIDQFWLSRAKQDQQKAEKLIRIFYRRVENANRHFTSYKEGWKTDRGMILIIFGNPTFRFQNKDGESWIYGEKNSMFAVNFIFNKIPNKFTENDYQLLRNPYLKNIWITAILSWNEGHPYSALEIQEKIYDEELRQRQNQLHIWY